MGDIPKCGAGLGYHLVLGTLYFENASTLALYPSGMDLSEIRVCVVNQGASNM